jgi:hypothetical protein
LKRHLPSDPSNTRSFREHYDTVSLERGEPPGGIVEVPVRPAVRSRRDHGIDLEIATNRDVQQSMSALRTPTKGCVENPTSRAIAHTLQRGDELPETPASRREWNILHCDCARTKGFDEEPETGEVSVAVIIRVARSGIAESLAGWASEQDIDISASVGFHIGRGDSVEVSE